MSSKGTSQFQTSEFDSKKCFLDDYLFSRNLAHWYHGISNQRSADRFDDKTQSEIVSFPNQPNFSFGNTSVLSIVLDLTIITGSL